MRKTSLQMNQNINNLKIHKVTILRDDASNYFKETGDVKKAGLLEYMSNTYVNL